MVSLHGCLAPVGHAELVENVSDVGLDRAGPEEERLGDLLIGLSPRQQAQDLHLALSQTSWVALTGGVAHRRAARAAARASVGAASSGVHR